MSVKHSPVSWKRAEVVLAVALVLFKLRALYVGWGRPRGYDWWPWTSAFGATHWFEPLPSPRALGASFHPPLSYLITRWVFWFCPDSVQASQIVSTLAIIGAALVLRHVLRRTGHLWTLPGLWLLYGGSSLPFVVWFGTETGPYDVLALAWFMVVLSLSVRLFWEPSGAWWRDSGQVVRVTALGLVLACALLNKFSSLVTFGVPFLVILGRRGPGALVRELRGPLVAAATGITIVGPLYYHRYYQTEGKIFPTSIDWASPDLPAARAARDMHPFQFIIHMLRIPDQPIVGTPVAVPDAFFQIIWHQVWRAEVALGLQAPLSSAVSDFYVRSCFVLMVLGTAWFFFRRRQVPTRWHHWGRILLGCSLLYSLSSVSFAWKYPLFALGLFKAKYIAPALFWIPYAVALPLSGEQVGWRARATEVGLVALVMFMFVNHLLPVY